MLSRIASCIGTSCIFSTVVCCSSVTFVTLSNCCVSVTILLPSCNGSVFGRNVSIGIILSKGLMSSLRLVSPCGATFVSWSGICSLLLISLVCDCIRALKALRALICPFTKSLNSGTSCAVLFKVSTILSIACVLSVPTLSN